jgi:hypothetical protein
VWGVAGFHFKLFSREWEWSSPLRGGQQSIGGEMAHDAFKTFKN